MLLRKNKIRKVQVNLTRLRISGKFQIYFRNCAISITDLLNEMFLNM